MGNIFSQSKGYINKDWVLLDSQSTIDLFCNASLLTNIRVVNDHLNIFCNAGSASTNIVGDLKGYGTVWFHDSGIANILSLHRVAERFHVTYDSHESNCFLRPFIPGPRGLYYCNLSNINGTILTTIDTVDNNKTKYIQRQLKYADSARKMQNTIGVTTQGLFQIIDNKMMHNFSIDRQSSNDALHIYGPSISNLREKYT